MAQGCTDCSYDLLNLTMTEDSPGTSNFKGQKVNLSSRRLTMPLEYLNREGARTPAKTDTTAKASHDILDNYDGASLKRSVLRRSARISARKKAKPSSFSRNSSGSKSVFQEINEKYIKLENTNFTLSPFLDGPQDVRRPPNHDFCVKLSQQTHPPSDAILLILKRKMEENFKIINSRLSGHTPRNSSKPMKRGLYQSSSEGNETERIAFEYFSPAEWVYSTPPRTKAPSQPKLESRIQPALLIKNDDKTVVYELERLNQFKRQKVRHEAQPMEFETEVRSLEKMCSGSFLFSDYQMSQYEESTRRPTRNLFDLNDCFVDGN